MVIVYGLIGSLSQQFLNRRTEEERLEEKRAEAVGFVYFDCDTTGRRTEKVTDTSRRTSWDHHRKLLRTMALSILQLGVRRSKKLIEKNVVAVNFVKNANFKNIRNLNDICICTPLYCSLVKEHEHHVREYSKHVKQQKKLDQKHESDSDSDEDFEVLGNRGKTDFWRRKIRTFHNILDVNKDGVISFDDFKILADKFVSLGHLDEENSKEFREAIKNLWEKQWGEITPYNLVTVEKYLEDMHHVLNDKDLSKKSHSFLPYLFKAVDKDGSGEITVEEFKLFFECLGLRESDAEIAFKSIDSNSDGKITMKEFIKHGRDFFFTEDETRISKFFWGPLVDK